MNRQALAAKETWTRRRLQGVAGALAVEGAGTRAAGALSVVVFGMSRARVLTGNGEWTYEIVAGWGALPAGKSFGGTLGAIAEDRAGNLYVSTQSTTGVLVFSPE